MRAAILILSVLLSTQGTYSLIKGTVFTADGHSFTGAKVTVMRTDIDPRKQKKTMRDGISDRNGEFAFRMDTGPAKFHLKVEADGYKPDEREIEIQADEHLDISVVLKK